MASQQLDLRSLTKQENAAPKCLDHGSAPLPLQSPQSHVLSLLPAALPCPPLAICA